MGAPPPVAPGGMPGAAPPLFNPAITSAVLPPDQIQWAQAGGNQPENPMGPPQWADNPTLFQQATALVKAHWASYPEPWAVVAMAYGQLKNAAGGAAAPPHPAAPPGPPGGPPKPPAGPPGGAPGGKPPFGGGGKPFGGPPKPPGA